jgi:3-hydroxybutyryl-CoA dehydrogenase
MNILVIGDSDHLVECQQKFGAGHEYSLLEAHREAVKFFAGNDLVFDFIIDEEPEEFEVYAEHETKVFLNTAKISLSELAHAAGNRVKSKIFGFNGLPTFFARAVMEVTVWKSEQAQELAAICETLGTPYLLVDDRVGMVTPRVICMIINEAYYTVQEGTATREDINMAMKLGTNYPYGPFEWCERIGVKHVYELLDALYEDTRDERYKICALLKKEYLQHA